MGLIFHFSHSSDLSRVPSGVFRWARLRKKGKHVVPAVLGPQSGPEVNQEARVEQQPTPLRLPCPPPPPLTPVTEACEPCCFGLPGSLWMLSQV